MRLVTNYTVYFDDRLTTVAHIEVDNFQSKDLNLLSCSINIYSCNITADYYFLSLHGCLENKVQAHGGEKKFSHYRFHCDKKKKKKK